MLIWLKIGLFLMFAVQVGEEASVFSSVLFFFPFVFVFL